MANETASTSKWHGKLGSRYNWENPKRTLVSSKKARPEYTTIESHEYCDREHVLKKKIEILADFVRQSKHCVAYTGAGLSVSSGLDDYASDRSSIQIRGTGAVAQPNGGHRAIVKLHMAGYLKAVVNQNHDGLLQKAGFPQQDVNEIHGSFFDPSNPGGNILRHDLFDNLLDHEAKVDLCLALGSSLSGLNADRLATSASKKNPGLVICNLQCTRLDQYSNLRIYAPLDDVLTRLSKQLGLTSTKVPTPIVTPLGFDGVFLLPYDSSTGELSRDHSKVCQLNMNVGSRFKILRGSYADCHGEVIGKRQDDGHWKLLIHQVIDENTKITDEHLLGSWWLSAAQQGLAPHLPIVPVLQQVDGQSNDSTSMIE